MQRGWMTIGTARSEAANCSPQTTDEHDGLVVGRRAIAGVRLITLNRPAKRNAIDRELFSALVESFATLDRDESIRAAVLTGADPAFCGGVDLDGPVRDRVYSA
jgi:enoyl-CoA hydratase/carnithine racemase